MENAFEEMEVTTQSGQKRLNIFKTALMILGVIFGIILIFIIILFVYSATAGIKFDKSSKEYVDTEVPKILSTWDGEELNSDASSAFLQVATSSQINDLMTRFSSDLGSFKSYNGSVGQSGIHFNNGVKTITAEYTASSTFQKGNADIFIQLVQQNGVWKINIFHLDELVPAQ